ncbi:MAG: pimeloyl-CoA dehydrogenase large subunit [Alphaproteobacteria bacterium]|nr:MAG: pimeloyl-CoA dehydrogenase large subunit [Alphaproteobacteria bacterium]
MDLEFTPEQQALRDEVREWLARELPESYRRKTDHGILLSKEEILDWHARLDRQGWLVPHWPREYGGTGWGPVERFIFEEELGLAAAPRVVPFGFTMLAPVLLRFGTREQCDYWLPRMRRGEDFWCQGYSEPGAGSDLASLRTEAVRDGDHYVVNGQKTWTTLAHYANMIFCLVRTSREGKPQEGISFLLIDMTSPGVEVRPIRTLEGGHEVNEVFFTDVRVPVANRVGEENRGWTYAKYLLTWERTNIAGVGITKRKLAKLRAIARAERRGGRPLIEDPLFAARLAKAEIALRHLEVTALRVLAAQASGEAPGAESSMLKILGTEIRQEIDDLTRRATGVWAQPWIPEALEPGWNGEPVGPDHALNAAAIYFNERKISIYGGSNEIQRNIIAKAMLGL